MKRAIPFLATVLLMAGCVTTPSGQARLDKAVAMIQYTVPSAVQVAVSEEPKAADYLRAAADVIDVAALNTNSSPATLLKDLSAINTLGATPLARLAVMAGVGVYVTFFADQVTSDAGTVTVMRAISQAIRDGLATPAGKRIKRSR